MPISAVSISGYRSIKNIRFPMGPLTVFVGKNGVGKTNLYRALHLLHSAADGRITRHVAEDGGVESVLWEGARRTREPVRLMFSAEIDNFDYRIEIGLPMLTEAALNLEPRVKEEELTLKIASKTTVIMNRLGANVWLRDSEGVRSNFPDALLPSETALSAFRDVGRYPALECVRRELLGCQFFHSFRTDPGSPVRRSCLAIASPSLASDGHDLAAVLATLYYVRGDPTAVERAIDEALPGTKLRVQVEGRRASFTLRFRDQPRAFAAHELSDGTLRYLCLVAALCSYRLPSFIALNEPESSLHQDLIPALAGLIARASQRTRIWTVTHSETLGVEIERLTGVKPHIVMKKDGATWIEGHASLQPSGT
jgi:predicted ATPase